MDSAAVFERADTWQRSGELFPGDSAGEKWVAVDPETECQGIGRFEEAARANLVYAVEAYRDEGGQTPYLSAGEPRTMEMRWRRETDSSLTEQLRGALPFGREL